MKARRQLIARASKILIAIDDEVAFEDGQVVAARMRRLREACHRKNGESVSTEMAAAPARS